MSLINSRGGARDQHPSLPSIFGVSVTSVVSLNNW